MSSMPSIDLQGRCPVCDGDLSLAFVSIQAHANRIAEVVEDGEFEITCDHCGFAFQAKEMEE